MMLTVNFSTLKLSFKTDKKDTKRRNNKNCYKL